MSNGKSLKDLEKQQKKLADDLAKTLADLIKKLAEMSKNLGSLNDKLGRSKLTRDQLRGLIGVYEKIGQGFGAIGAYFDSLGKLGSTTAMLENFLPDATSDADKVLLHGAKIVTLQGALEICKAIANNIEQINQAIADGEAIFAK